MFKDLLWKIHQCASVFPVKTMVHGKIDFLISNISFVIFECFFDGRYTKHKCKRKNTCNWSERTNLWNQYENSDHQEIKVGKSLKLFKEILWDEIQYRIFCCGNLVHRKGIQCIHFLFIHFYDWINVPSRLAFS